jgi:hypothetical protein
MTSAYEDLKEDFNEMRSWHAIVVQEKADLENTERQKAWWFQNSLLKKLAELHHDTEASVAALGGDVRNSLLMPLSLIFWNGFGWRLQRCPAPSLSACGEGV